MFHGAIDPPGGNHSEWADAVMLNASDKRLNREIATFNNLFFSILNYLV